VRQAQEGAIASAGARAVVEAMREHPAHAAIQRKGCARLLDLTPSVEGAEYQRILRENGGEWMEMDRKYRELASAGVIDVVCQALSTQPAEVAATGCRVLTFLARSDANLGLIARLGGIEALVTAMQGHATDPGVQEWACRALVNLTVNNAENQVKISNLGGIEAILKAMKDHPTVAEVQKQACWALCHIGWSNPALQRRIKAMGVEEHVRRAMAAANATEKTKEKGQKLLDRLAQC
jgi:hypothetical protein